MLKTGRWNWWRKGIGRGARPENGTSFFTLCCSKERLLRGLHTSYDSRRVPECVENASIERSRAHDLVRFLPVLLLPNPLPSLHLLRSLPSNRVSKYSDEIISLSPVCGQTSLKIVGTFLSLPTSHLRGAALTQLQTNFRWHRSPTTDNLITTASNYRVLLPVLDSLWRASRREHAIRLYVRCVCARVCEKRGERDERVTKI